MPMVKSVVQFALADDKITGGTGQAGQNGIDEFRAFSRNDEKAVAKNRVLADRLFMEKRLLAKECRHQRHLLEQEHNEFVKLADNLKGTTGYVFKEDHPEQDRCSSRITSNNIEGTPTPNMMQYDPPLSIISDRSCSPDSPDSFLEPNQHQLPKTNNKQVKFNGSNSNYSKSASSSNNNKRTQFQARSISSHGFPSSSSYLNNPNNKQPERQTKSALPVFGGTSSQQTRRVNSIFTAGDSSRDRNTRTSSAGLSRTATDLAEWNKLEAKKLAKAKKEKELRDSLFQDKKFYKKYMDLCRERDAVPKESPERIAYLKQADPVFAKRHKLFLSSKMCNRAPKFDLNDYYVSITKVQKFALDKGKDACLRDNEEKVQEEGPRFMQADLERVNDKVRKFLRTLSSF